MLIRNLMMLVSLLFSTPALSESEDTVPATTKLVERTDRKALERHRTILGTFDRAYDVAVIGDSMVERWQPSWMQKAFAGRTIVNLGVGGDRTQNVLWRLANMPLDSIAPSTVVIVVGTNNLTDRSTPRDIAAGIEAIVTRTTRAWPDAKIYVSDIFPRGKQLSFRNKDRVALNDLLMRAAPKRGYTFVKTDETALRATAEDGTYLAYVPDLLHLSPTGYEIIGRSLAKAVAGQ